MYCSDRKRNITVLADYGYPLTGSYIHIDVAYREPSFGVLLYEKHTMIFL